MSYSIVEYLGESSKEKCGYCKETGGYNSHGFWAHSLKTEDYQMLIDRNWRRSGQYLYLPTNSNTCCPMYTIKCDAKNFKLRRSQKKILKKINQFLKDGKKEKKSRNQSDSSHSQVEEPKPPKEHSEISTEVEKMEMDVTHIMSASQKKADTSVAATVTDESNVPAQSKKVNPRKKKIIRLERKIAKLAAKGLTLADVKPRHKKNVEKTLEDYLAAEPKDGKHKLTVKLVASTEGSSSFKLFEKYQNIIHKDPPEKNSLKGYERFLVSSPLKTKIVSLDTEHGLNVNVSFDLFRKYERSVHKSIDNNFDDFNAFLASSPLKFEKDETTPPDGFGSFHYQYYLDDELIAVGVIDILPLCVSSVYFFYNPDYNFLSLGTYASLREIALVRELSKKCPDLSNYYLGYYLPTCPKMRYKANVKPSYLLCPEIFTWHHLDNALSAKLDAVRYTKINESESIERDAMTRKDLNDVLVLSNRTAMKYSDFKRITRKKKEDDKEQVFEYASKVGKTLSQKMLLYRN